MPQISAASAQCLSAFGQLCSRLDTASQENAQPMPLADVQSQRGRFRVWCGNLGALQQGPSSADYRLRESPVIQSNVVKLLQQLRSHLTESTAVVSGSRPAFEDQPKPEDSSASETEDESNSGLAVAQPKRELEMRLSRIKAILRDLYKLGFKIRNPHIRPVSLHASLYRQVDSETNVDVFDLFAVFDNSHVDELLKQLRKGRPAPAGFVDYMKPRLAAAITRRRRQFKYWERHARKLDSQAYEIDDEPEIIPPQNIPEKIGEGNETELPKREHVLGALKSHANYTLLSQTEASRYNENLDNRSEVGTVMTTASTAIDINGNYVELPDPPALANEEDFTCPYCFVLCEQKYGRKKPWRTHLLHDLQPYVCTYDECANGDQLFASRKTWAEHEASVHRQSWRCFEHSLYYKSAAGLRDHFTKEHAGSLTKKQMDGLLDLAATGMADNRDMCPICFEATPFPKGLENHIANHLERFSIFALPRSCVDTEQSFHGSVSQRNGSRSTWSFSHETLDFSDNGVANDATSLTGLEDDVPLISINSTSDQKDASIEEQDTFDETEYGTYNERQPYKDQNKRHNFNITNEDEDENEEYIFEGRRNMRDKGKAKAKADSTLPTSNAPALAGCLHEAERSKAVAIGLESLRNALPKDYHGHLNVLIQEIYTTEQRLRDLAEKARIHISRMHIATGYIYDFLPCLARTLINIIVYYQDRSLSRENRWRTMYNEMSNELPSMTLPARFILFNDFLSLLISLIINMKYPADSASLVNRDISSPTTDIVALDASRLRVLELRRAQEISNSTSRSRHELNPAMLIPEYSAIGMHWAMRIFSRPLATRTLLQSLEGAKSLAFGPFLGPNHLVNPANGTILFQRSFDHGSINLTAYLNGQQCPYLLLRTVKQGQRQISLKGAHELCIARASPNIIVFTRWSRSENRDKVWARLLFGTWEELVLFHHTFNSLKARSPATVACHPRESVIRNDSSLFQAQIVDDGYNHGLNVRQESLTGCMRLVATVWEGELKGSPVWTAFVPAMSMRSEARWISRKSKFRVWLRDIQPYVFCQTYDANRQRDAKTGNFVLNFVKEAGATHFQELFQSGNRNDNDEEGSQSKSAGSNE